MKAKLKALFLIIVISSTTNQLFSQAFEKGNWNIDLDLGGAAYGVRTTSTVAIGAFTFTDTDVSGTASSIFRLGGEYGISNKIGLGLKIGASNYVIAPEDKDTLKSVKSNDFTFYFNFHLLKAQRNDLFLTLGLGFASGKWTYQEDPGILLSSITGSGNAVVLGITDRIFFSDHVGLLLSLQYTGYNYRGATPELSSSGKAFIGNLNYSWKLDFELKGVYLGTGLAIKF
jgi:hypothetical protein